jgi:hypothetical protein
MAMTTERFERSTSFLVILMVVSVSAILMLRRWSAELGWDEAEYAPSVNNGCKYLWSRYLEADYSRTELAAESNHVIWSFKTVRSWGLLAVCASGRPTGLMSRAPNASEAARE